MSRFFQKTEYFKKISSGKLTKNKEIKSEKVYFPINFEEFKNDKENKNGNQPKKEESTTQSQFKSHFNPSFDPNENYTKFICSQESDKFISKFYGYFYESVPQSRLEETRIRKLEISVFSCDNTISIVEPRQRNSGILQGIFLKKQNVLNQEGTKFITCEDFEIGRDILISGHRISIYACDPATRNFFEKINKPISPNMELPSDNFESKVLQGFIPKKSYGLNSYALNGCVPSQKQFLENDRKVLKFFSSFEEELYIVHYYLCDDSIEVIEIKLANSGKDPFPKLIRRQKIQKEYKVEINKILKPAEYFTFADINHHQEIELLKKKFLILGCDNFTGRFYKEMMGIDFPVYTFAKTDEHAKTNIIIPPHNGFGSEEDSLQNVLKLLPKVPKKDYFSLVDNSIFLRFIAVLLTDEEENAKRFYNQKIRNYVVFE